VLASFNCTTASTKAKAACPTGPKARRVASSSIAACIAVSKLKGPNGLSQNGYGVVLLKVLLVPVLLTLLVQYY
jgi:hypothetical protein